MAIDTNPYIPRNPGDLITAADWVNVQLKIKEDIGKQIQTAINNLTTVKNSENTHKIDNQTSDELTEAILEKAKQELPKRTGYQRLFKHLKFNEETVIKHDLDTNPLVDIYQLDPFEVICSEDDEKTKNNTTLFYLYHTSEKKLRATIGGATATADIEPAGRTPFRIPFHELLSLYKVSYTDDSSLGDLETEFWDAFFKAPNDEFDDDTYCHSPWFDRCCGENRTVAELKRRGDWDEIWFKVKPRKTINFPAPSGDTKPFPAPPPLQVVHFDHETIGIGYPPKDEPSQATATASAQSPAILPLMILLKV